MHTLHYQDYFARPCYCYVEVTTTKGKTVVIATSPERDDMGMSVTNSWPFLADAIAKEFQFDRLGVNRNDVIWIEHYPDRGSPSHPIEETYDQVFMIFVGAHYQMVRDRHPWQHLNEEQLREILTFG